MLRPSPSTDQYGRGRSYAASGDVGEGHLGDTTATPRTSARDSGFKTARGEVESDMEFAWGTAREGFDTDRGSVSELGTYRTACASCEGDLETRGGAPSHGGRKTYPIPDPSEVVGEYAGGRTAYVQRKTSGTILRMTDHRGGDAETPQAPSRARSYDSRLRTSVETSLRANNDQPKANGHRRGPSFPTARGGRGRRLETAFRQDKVEDIFSYARHNRVKDLERMLDQGVPVDIRDGHGNTVLIIACQNGHKRALKAALRMGADPNARNSLGNTGLHFCHAFGYGKTLGRYLRDKGADSSIRNQSGLSCVDGIGR